MKQGDGNCHSKKDSAVRSQELRKIVSPPICAYLTENLSAVLSSNQSTLLLTCVLKHASSSEDLQTRLAEEAAKPFCPGEDDNLVERPATHMMLKKLVQHDKVRREEDPSARLFSLALLEQLDEDGMESWITCNRGAFLFVIMIETRLEDVMKALREKTKCVTKTLKRQKTKGAEALKQKLTTS